MKVRIKYTKTGVLRFIGHLDIMRLFQKAIRRARLSVSYTKGFSPHQIISFAAPMPLGMTSEGEYFDGEFDEITSTEDMKKRLNDTLPDGIRVLDVILLPADAKPSMSIVTASDYLIYRHAESTHDRIPVLLPFAERLLDEDGILVMKKTKTKEVLTDIKPFIYRLRAWDDGENTFCGASSGIYMQLASGSTDNLKPELVLEALCAHAKLPYERLDYGIHRLETYTGTENAWIPLWQTGEHF